MVTPCLGYSKEIRLKVRNPVILYNFWKLTHFLLQVWEFLLFAGLMLVDMGVFVVLAMRYQYREEIKNQEDSDGGTQETVPMDDTSSFKSAKE